MVAAFPDFPDDIPSSIAELSVSQIYRHDPGSVSGRPTRTHSSFRFHRYFILRRYLHVLLEISCAEPAEADDDCDLYGDHQFDRDDIL